MVTVLVGVSVFQGVLKHDGVSLAFVYGIYPVTAQLIALGAVGRDRGGQAAVAKDSPSSRSPSSPPEARSPGHAEYGSATRGVLRRGPRLRRRPACLLRASR